MLKDQSNSFKKRLEAYRENPDADVWDRISGQLPDNDIGNQLANYEELPDANVWDSIQSVLKVSVGFDWLSAATSVITVLSLVGLLTLKYSPGNLQRRSIVQNEKEGSFSGKNEKTDSIRNLDTLNRTSESNKIKAHDEIDSLKIQNRFSAINTDPKRSSDNRNIESKEPAKNEIDKNGSEVIAGKKAAITKSVKETHALLLIKNGAKSANNLFKDSLMEKNPVNQVTKKAVASPELTSEMAVVEQSSAVNSIAGDSSVWRNNSNQQQDSFLENIPDKKDSASLVAEIPTIKQDSVGKK